MDFKTHRFISYILYSTLFTGAVLLYFLDSHPYRFIALALYFIFSISILYIHLRLYKNEKYSPKAKYILIALLFLDALINIFNNSGYSGYYFVLSAAAALIIYDLKFGLTYTIIAMLLHLFILFYNAGFDTATFYKLNGVFLLPRFFMIVVILITRYAIQTSNRNKELAQLLQEKTERLEDTLLKLNESMEELKQTADLKAREKLMQELHDKLGHLLTTACIGVQAAGVLIQKDTSASKKRLDMAAQQIQEAMQSLRSMITGRSIDLNDTETSLTNNIIRLISETEKHTGISIRHNLPGKSAENFDALPDHIRVFIFNALMEGITNGIQHGEASEFDFILTYARKGICFYLKDNGKGFDKITPGYGLLKMRRDAKKIGAKHEIRCENGCILKITIPICNKNTLEEA